MTPYCGTIIQSNNVNRNIEFTFPSSNYIYLCCLLRNYSGAEMVYSNSLLLDLNQTHNSIYLTNYYRDTNNSDYPSQSELRVFEWSKTSITMESYAMVYTGSRYSYIYTYYLYYICFT